MRIRATTHTSGSALWTLYSETGANSTVVNNLAIASITAGANAIGDVGGVVRTAAGGFATVNRLLSAAATTNSTLVKGSVGRLYKIAGYNASAALRYLKLYNKATAPTVGTDVPVVTLALPANAPFVFDFDNIGQSFPLGIGFGLTTGAADADVGALTANDIQAMNIWYA